MFFLQNPQKIEYVPVYQPVTRHPQRPGSLSVFIRMPWQPPGAKPLPTSRGAFGPRQDQNPGACDRDVRRMLTRMAHHPVDNSILHGMRRFARRSWRSAKRAQAHATRPHRFRQHRTQHRTRPRFRPTRTHPFRHPTHPSVRTHPATIPFPPAKPNQLRGINNLHAHTSHPSHPL